MPRIGILRHQLGVTSEPFILEQARSFAASEPVLIGRDALPPDWNESVPAVSIEGLLGRRASTAYALGLSSEPLRATLQSQQVDILLAHFGVEGTFAIPATQTLGIPLATVFHGFDATVSLHSLLKSGRPAWMQYAMRRRRLKRHGTIFLPVSGYIAERLRGLGFPQDRTVVHHTGIDLRGVSQVVPPAEVDPYAVVAVARLVEKRGLDLLIRAVAMGRARGVPLTLTCVGEGPLRRSLQALAQELGCGAAVRFLGALNHSDTLREIASGAIVSLPSARARGGDAEGLGHVLLEAAALGKPVVASLSGGIPDAVADGTTGILVPEGDVPALAGAIVRLAEQPQLAAAMGAEGTLLVTREFDVAAQTRSLEQRLLGLLRA